jgi:uncharacterized integral membrane protein
MRERFHEHPWQKENRPKPGGIDPIMLFLIAMLILSVPLIIFALSNTAMVRLGLWPTDYTLDVHLSVAILVAMAVAFLIGGFLMWLATLAQRSRARRAERTVRLLEAQIEQLRTRPTLSLASPALPPTG